MFTKEEQKEADEIIDKQMTQEFYLALVQAFLELPKELMKTSRSVVWMYNSVLRLTISLCSVAKVSKEKLFQDLDIVWDTGAGEGEIIFEDKTLN